jgi:Ca-activated chloride channel family protein
MKLQLYSLLSFALLATDAVPQDRVAVFNADARMVLVPTTVIDRHGATVSGLRSDAFLVSQDNLPQRIATFGEEDVPVSVGVVFDCSGSMRQVLPRAKAVMKTFFEASNPDDEAFLYTVASRPNRDSGFTPDFNSLVEHMIFADAGGSTALVDTIMAAVRQSRTAHRQRKALLVISDGMDNHSRYSRGDLIGAALEADLQIYSITVYDPPLTKKPIELREERDGLSFLEEITRRTGGIQATARTAREMEDAAQAVAKAMRDQYLIGYVPGSTPSNSAWHAIAVSLNVSNARAYARSGYFVK